MVVKGNLVVECEKCKRQHTINAGSLEWDCEEKNDRKQGVESRIHSEHEIDCPCGEKITIEANIWEYPIGAFNTDDYRVSGGKIVIKQVDVEFNDE